MTPPPILEVIERLGCRVQFTQMYPPIMILYDHDHLTSHDQKLELKRHKEQIRDYLNQRVRPEPTESTAKRPEISSSRLHMLNEHGVVTRDHAKCFMWTREELGYGWWYAFQFSPPLR